ncbi:hypothetical protein V6N13_116163 [Hibiscus sabdariffa]
MECDAPMTARKIVSYKDIVVGPNDPHQSPKSIDLDDDNIELLEDDIAFGLMNDIPTIDFSERRRDVEPHVSDKVLGTTLAPSNSIPDEAFGYWIVEADGFSGGIWLCCRKGSISGPISTISPSILLSHGFFLATLTPLFQLTSVKVVLALLTKTSSTLFLTPGSMILVIKLINGIILSLALFLVVNDILWHVSDESNAILITSAMTSYHGLKTLSNLNLSKSWAKRSSSGSKNPILSGLLLGDRNTSYFHMRATLNKRMNRISKFSWPQVNGVMMMTGFMMRLSNFFRTFLRLIVKSMELFHCLDTF